MHVISFCMDHGVTYSTECYIVIHAYHRSTMCQCRMLSLLCSITKKANWLLWCSFHFMLLSSLVLFLVLWNYCELMSVICGWICWVWNQHKNLLILYDAIGTLADSVGHHLNQPVICTCVSSSTTLSNYWCLWYVLENVSCYDYFCLGWSNGAVWCGVQGSGVPVLQFGREIVTVLTIEVLDIKYNKHKCHKLDYWCKVVPAVHEHY